jgi:hypothetical protein
MFVHFCFLFLRTCVDCVIDLWAVKFACKYTRIEFNLIMCANYATNLETSVFFIMFAVSQRARVSAKYSGTSFPRLSYFLLHLFLSLQANNERELKHTQCDN